MAALCQQTNKTNCRIGGKSNGKLFQNYSVSPDRKPLGHHGLQRTFRETLAILVIHGIQRLQDNRSRMRACKSGKPDIQGNRITVESKSYTAI